MSEDNNDFVCKRTLEVKSDGRKYEGCKNCCIHCLKNKTCESACILVESDLKECPEALSIKAVAMGEVFSTPDK